MIIKPKPTLLTKIIYSLLFIGIAIFLFSHFIIRLDGAYTYFITTMTVFVGLLYGFKLNRNELHAIMVNGNVIDFSFLNKSFYKRKDMQMQRQDIKAVLKKDQMQLFANQALFAVVQKKSVTAVEWGQLNALFSH